MQEYYFSKRVDDSTWRSFAINEANRDIDKYYERIEESLDSKFVFNQNGKAFYISPDRLIYDGVWFEIGDRKIAVFKKF